MTTKFAEIAEFAELKEEDVQKINDVFASVLTEIQKSQTMGALKIKKRWFGSIESQNSSRPDKWDVLSALFIAVGVAAAMFGIAWAASYMIASLSSGQIVASVSAFAMNNPISAKSVAKKLETFIMDYMPWLVMKDPMLSVRQLHQKTKKFLIKHFGTVEDFQAFLAAE